MNSVVVMAFISLRIHSIISWMMERVVRAWRKENDLEISYSVSWNKIDVSFILTQVNNVVIFDLAFPKNQLMNGKQVISSYSYTEWIPLEQFKAHSFAAFRNGSIMKKEKVQPGSRPYCLIQGKGRNSSFSLRSYFPCAFSKWMEKKCISCIWWVSSYF